MFAEDGTYLEAYWQGIFKVAEPSAFDLHRYGLAQQRITLIET